MSEQTATSASGPAPAGTPGLSFSDILTMISRRRVLFSVPLVTVFLGSLVVGLLMPKTYETSSFIEIKSKKLIDPLVSGLAVSPNSRDEVDTLSKQIMAWPRLELLVNQLKLIKNPNSPVAMEDYIKSLRKNISVRFRNKEIVEISYQDSNPRKAQQIVNTLTQNFIEENTRLQREEARNAIDFIEQQLAIYREKLESSQQNFSASKIDTDLRTALNRRTLLRDKLANIQRIVPTQVTTEQNPVVSQLQGRLGLLETDLARLMIDAKEGSPRVIEVKREIAGLRTRIAQEMDKRNVKESISTFNPMYLQTEQEIKEVDMTIAELLKQKREVEGVKEQPKKVSTIELSNLERNKKVDEDIYQMLLRQLESAYVSMRLQDSEKGSRFTIIEYARMPLRPSKPRMERVLAVGLGLGFALGFGLVFLLETGNKSFQTPEQAVSLLNLTSLGSTSKIIIPGADDKGGPVQDIKSFFNKMLESKPALSKLRFVTPYTAKIPENSPVSPQVVIYHDARSTIAEEFRVIRTSIFHGIKNPPQVILMTSTLRGEGKSTSSANLAVAFADSGKKTLLVDCDLRKGVAAELFGIEADAGLSDLINNWSAGDPVKVIRETPVFNLHLLPSGKSVEKPSELLGSPRLKQLITDLRQKYDVIILDSTPALNLPDSSIISKLADGVILVAQSGRTRQSDVQRTLAVLKHVDANVIGFILTNIQYHMPRYVYDYYYNTGYETYHTGT